MLCAEFKTGKLKWEERSIAPGSLCYAAQRLYIHGENGDVALVINTVGTAASHADSLSIRREALNRGLAYFTTMRGARAAVMGIEAILKKELTIRSLQEYHCGS